MHCSRTCAGLDSRPRLAVARSWKFVASWADIAVGSRVKVLIGEETIVGLYFAVDDQDQRDIAHLVTSESCGDVRFGETRLEQLLIEVEIR
jgi:hypothetical protein